MIQLHEIWVNLNDFNKKSPILGLFEKILSVLSRFNRQLFVSNSLIISTLAYRQISTFTQQFFITSEMISIQSHI